VSTDRNWLRPMTDAPEKPKPMTSKPHHPQVIHTLFPIVTFFDFCENFPTAR
jgi:hypothetical protein